MELEMHLGSSLLLSKTSGIEQSSSFLGLMIFFLAKEHLATEKDLGIIPRLLYFSQHYKSSFIIVTWRQKIKLGFVWMEN